MTPRIAIKMMLWLLGTVIIFHSCILLKIIPYEITWGGRLQNDTEMYVFESISILINLFLAFVLSIKGNYLTEIIPMKIVNVTLWIFLVLFGLNTIGNVLAKTYFEKFFSLLTLTSAILIWIALKKDKKQKHYET
ncbi:MAG: hypothetical protein ACPHXR_09850 [Flavicella sp.]